jgi:hypothetical protein
MDVSPVSGAQDQRWNKSAAISVRNSGASHPFMEQILRMIPWRDDGKKADLSARPIHVLSPDTH